MDTTFPWLRMHERPAQATNIALEAIFDQLAKLNRTLDGLIDDSNRLMVRSTGR